MGAVASLIYLTKKEKYSVNSIVAGVFDSPFHSLYDLALEIGAKNLGFPQAILRPFIYIMKKKLEDKINF